MNDSVELRYNVATATEIADHLASNDAAFIPRLSERVTISEYAQKIVDRAERFEAWAHGSLIGLVAAYFNETAARNAFITSVSVMPAYRHQGLATRLLVACVESARRRHLDEVSLEVDRENLPAVDLYRTQGFTVASVSGRTIRMNLDTRKDVGVGGQS
jgi:ribosomal protein S18 acetylase RimI-like enzyme